MNLTVYSPEGVTIGSQVFNSTPIDLVNITCLESDNYTALYNSAEVGELIIKDNTVDVPQTGDRSTLAYISRLINLDQGNGCDYELLKTDWENKI